MRAFAVSLVVACGIAPIIAAARSAENRCERLRANLDADRLVVIQGHMSGRVVTGKGRLHFHSAPSGECRTEVFIVPGDAVDVVEEREGFSRATFVNPDSGDTAGGWLESDRLKPSGFGIAPKQWRPTGVAGRDGSVRDHRSAARADAGRSARRLYRPARPIRRTVSAPSDG